MHTMIHVLPFCDVVLAERSNSNLFKAITLYIDHDDGILHPVQVAHRA
jgi:hypothetical protein